LVTANTEWLTGRASDHNWCPRKVGVFGQNDLFALAVQVFPVGCGGVRIFFEAQCGEPLRFKAESEATASGEQIKNQGGMRLFWFEQRIDSI
jgi:hypothetical protein